MSTITLNLTPDAEQKLRRKAVSAGLSVESYLDRLVERDVSDLPPRRRTFDEIAEPVRLAFEESGMTDEDVAALVEEAREEIRQEKKARMQS